MLLYYKTYYTACVWRSKVLFYRLLLIAYCLLLTTKHIIQYVYGEVKYYFIAYCLLLTTKHIIQPVYGEVKYYFTIQVAEYPNKLSANSFCIAGVCASI